ncbi:hypothetical protein CR513_25809, partial [Mucuna pruriens]
MHIKLERPLLISSFTTINGQDIKVNIADNACLIIFKSFDVTHGSIDVTISNNWFRNQENVMHLRYDDEYVICDRLENESNMKNG